MQNKMLYQNKNYQNFWIFKHLCILSTMHKNNNLGLRSENNCKEGAIPEISSAFPDYQLIYTMMKELFWEK